MIPNRLAFKVGHSAALTIATEASPAWKWNEDILLASMYQSSYAGLVPDTTGSKWCSPWHAKLNADGSPLNLVATKGFNGKTKCTWLIQSSDGSSAPVFTLRKANYANFVFQWMEWINVAGLGANAVLPPLDGGDFHLGAYPTTNNEVYLNPAIGGVSDSGSWDNSAIKFAFNEKDPSTHLPGSIGDAIYFPNLPTALNAT